jgi:hypothetical protein
MMRDENNAGSKTTSASKKPYRKPSLRVLGRLGSVTQGGTGQSNEGSMTSVLTRRS